MLFSSVEFIFLFLPAALLGFQLLSKIGKSYGQLYLILASLFFYAYWRPSDLTVLAASIGVNFFLSRLIVRARESSNCKPLVILAVFLNLGLLIWYKYLSALILAMTPANAALPAWVEITLPLGISFFTLTQIAYLVDLSQEEADPESLLRYTLFVTFFPHLIAGPIVHHAEIMKQFKEPGKVGLNPHDFAIGISWFILGLSKKIIIADPFGPVADVLFSNPTAVDTTGSWIGALSYSIQLYFDFSGYSDMALGLARLFSIRFPINFDSPYKAKSIIEYWSRWHMTLTRFITSYLYNPISLHLNRRRMRRGQRLSKAALRTPVGFLELVALPTVITMLVAGIWHGAGLQYVVFGALHGFYLSINHAWRMFDKSKLFSALIFRPFFICLTYLSVLIAQVFFRADNVHDAIVILKGMLHFHSGNSLALADIGRSVPTRVAHLLEPKYAVSAFAVCFAIIWFLPNTQCLLGEQNVSNSSEPTKSKWFTWSPSFAWLSGSAILFAICFLLSDSTRSFLYFQF
jgi:D-alanyl-lipoteichoic acid acyltransferase DltB (MBOAT superfamily)